MRHFGLLGKDISYSFSKSYFQDKFNRERIINAVYHQFDIDSLDELKNILSQYQNLIGINVTIPYKEEIISFLDELHITAKKIGAVNTIKLDKGRLIGYNTDVYGFKNALKPFLKAYHTKALILGTGGASKAVAFVLDKLGVEYMYVSRNAKGVGILSYKDVNRIVIQNFPLIINCTPLGTFPDVEQCPKLPYHFVCNKNLFFDLVYNPTETKFMKQAKDRGAVAINGLDMLKLQAEASWKIWNTNE